MIRLQQTSPINSTATAYFLAETSCTGGRRLLLPPPNLAWADATPCHHLLLHLLRRHARTRVAAHHVHQTSHALSHAPERRHHCAHLILRVPRSSCDTRAARRAAHENVRGCSLSLRHRCDHRLEALEVLLRLTHLVIRDSAHAGKHLHHRRHRPKACHHLALLEEVVEVKLVGHHALHQALGILLLNSRLGALDEREHVAHAQDASCHAIGVELL
mmetsp:Transcript_2410/g.5295  ORF Transcript_2410/g.5295 Transcript_2410/m.5295 type:complete len:216 (-) Transcript_2410:291-938(-)